MDGLSLNLTLMDDASKNEMKQLQLANSTQLQNNLASTTEESFEKHDFDIAEPVMSVSVSPKIQPKHKAPPPPTRALPPLQ